MLRIVNNKIQQKTINIAKNKIINIPKREYHSRIIDHYENPRNVGSFNKESKYIGTGLVGAPACGDVMKLQIKVDNGIIIDAKFKTFGCGSAIASSSLITTMIKGMSLQDAEEIKNSETIIKRVERGEKIAVTDGEVSAVLVPSNEYIYKHQNNDGP